MESPDRSQSAPTNSVRSDKDLVPKEALSERKDIEHYFEELSLEYSEVNTSLRLHVGQAREENKSRDYR